MHRWQNRFFAVSLIVLLCAMLTGLAHAAESPRNAAEGIRKTLFEAQSALMSQDVTGAAAALTDARHLYEHQIQVAFSADLDASVQAAFDSAAAAIEAKDATGLAIYRGMIWTGLLQGSTQVVFGALEKDDADAAQAWLQVREFRASTKFSRPGADATLAVDGLLNGQVEAAKALEMVRADLFDTYQAQLNESLVDADQANDREFSIRRAEESGLAAGYFAILSATYGEQRGEVDLKSAQNAFAALTLAAENNDAAAYAQAREQVTAVLTGFRAAPLAEAEQARRAGQLLRFSALVPVEYERGVRDGVVVKDIEIQEARTFLAGARAAFADLQVQLVAIDPEKTSQVETLLLQLEEQINITVDPAEVQSSVDELNQVLMTLLPVEWQSVNSDSDVDVIFSVLDQVVVAVAQKQYALAESARLEAYALLELGIEQRLRGFAPEKAIEIESLFWQGDAASPGLADLLGKQAAPADVKATVALLKTALTDAQSFLNSAKSAPEVVVGNAAIIVFREGLEAVVILASLLASLRTAEERKFRRPIIVGSVLALLATVITWWFANQLLMSMMRLGERLEAIVSLIAIGVLLLITNWFFHKVYWTGWIANFHTKKRMLVGGVMTAATSQAIGLILLGFTSIYREGFETVLFLQSLVLEAGLLRTLEGVALGMIGVAIVGAITFSFQVRLPYKTMLVVTGVLIGVVLLTMVGNTVHVMQAVGWMPITPVAGLYFPYWMGQWFGLFPTWQGLGFQFLAGAFVIGSYYLAEYRNHSRRGRGTNKTKAPQNPDAALEAGD